LATFSFLVVVVVSYHWYESYRMTNSNQIMTWKNTWKHFPYWIVKYLKLFLILVLCEDWPFHEHISQGIVLRPTVEIQKLKNWVSSLLARLWWFKTTDKFSTGMKLSVRKYIESVKILKGIGRHFFRGARERNLKRGLFILDSDVA